MKNTPNKGVQLGHISAVFVLFYSIKKQTPLRHAGERRR